MPKLPKWMASAMELIFSGMYHPVTVSSTEQITPKLQKVCFKGDFSKIKRPFKAGDQIEFRVSDTEFRHYTPAYVDTKKGICEVLFFLHANGPGTNWVRRLKQGDKIKLLGPGGKLSINEKAEYHFLMGDETSLGFSQDMIRTLEQCNCNYLALLELDKENLNWPNQLGLNCTSVEKTTNPKDTNIIQEMSLMLASSNLDKENIAFYLTGNAKSIQAVRKFLLNQESIKSSQIQTDPFWSPGKTGL